MCHMLINTCSFLDEIRLKAISLIQKSGNIKLVIIICHMCTAYLRILSIQYTSYLL